MSTLATRVLRRAAGEIGYSRWTDPNRGTKYARETQPALWPKDTWLLANGISYCDIFVTWVFWKEGLLHILPAGASYNTDYRASKGGRVPLSQAQPGDVLVFDWNWSTKSTNHVGILEKVTKAGNPQTIEGNTSPGARGSQSDGGGVYRRVRRWDQVRYVIRPDWSKADAGKPAKPAVIESLTSKAKAPPFPLPRKPGAMYYYGPADGPRTSVSGRTRNSAVPKDVTKDAHGKYRSIGLYAWQKRMKERGWKEIIVDGKYGPNTEKIAKQFQKSKGLKVDGLIGPGTWAAAWTEPVK